MPTQSSSSAQAAKAAERIYLNPPKFWAATRNMTEQDVERLADELFRLADERKIDELSRYDFISFGHRRVA